MASPSRLDQIGHILPRCTPQERREIEELLKSSGQVWYPLPGPQFQAYHADVDVLGYGGAAGGGKTDLALGKALTRHTRTSIFRRHGTEVRSIIDRLVEIVGHNRGLNMGSGGANAVWRDPVPGKTIEFGSCPSAGDERKYQGRPKDLLVIDEATNFLRSQVEYLMGWVRTTDPRQKCQTLLTFNPPETPDQQWILEYFSPWLDPQHPLPAEFGEVRWFARVEGEDIEVERPEPFVHEGERIVPYSKTFILSRVTDNPYLLRTNYVRQLQALAEPMRSRLLYADFRAAMVDSPLQVCPSEWVDEAMRRWTDRVPKPDMVSLGVDVARGGADDTVIARRHAGLWFDRPLIYPGKSTPDGPSVAALVVSAARGGAPVHIDAIGVGASPFDFLKQNYRGPVVGVNVATAAPGSDKSGTFTFANLRSYLWWRMREALDPANDTGIALPPDPRLRKELCAARWQLRGRVVYVESRDDLIKRIGVSPDLASAYILALIETPLARSLPGRAERSVAERIRGHDPYAEAVLRR